MKRAILLALALMAAASPAHARTLANARTESATAEVSGAPPEGSTAPAPEGSTAPAPEGSTSPAAESRAERRARLREARRALRGRCRLSVKLAPGPLVAGEAATLLGALSCPLAEEEAGRTVTIEQHVRGSTGYRLLGSASTQADGSFQFTTTEGVSANSSFRALTALARRAHAAAKVVPAVSLAGPAAGAQLQPAGRRAGTAALAERTVTFSGAVGGVEAGTLVVLQREDPRENGSWQRIGLARAGAGGRYSITHAFVESGPAIVRVVVHARGMRTVSSEPLSYEVAARENPRLTIETSNATPALGEPVTISGTAAAGPGTSLTLLSASRGGAREDLTTVLAGPGGRYQFAPQTLTRATTFRVTGAGTSSSSVREALRPALSLKPLPADLQAGQPLDVCGQVTPAPAGEVVLLQRESPGGIGFHTVAEASLAPDGSFCVEHAPAAAGTQVYRVKLPLTGELDASASEAFSLDVSAAAEAPAAGAPPAPVEEPPSS